MRPRNLLVLLVVLLLGWQAWERRTPARVDVPTSSSAFPGAGTHGAQDATDAAVRDVPSPFGTADTRAPQALPAGAAEVLARIRVGGPFRYERDGVVFGNFERRLPQRARGYYREYTVPTPGQRGRGARRIVAGGDPPSEFWYTADHYESFVRIDGNHLRAGNGAADDRGARQ